MIDVEVAITIRRSRHDVAAVMFNPDHDAEWIGGVEQARRSDPGPIRRGVRLERVTRRFWRRCAHVLEVVEHVPERALELIGQRPCEQRFRYTLEGVPEGTIARIHASRRATGRVRLPSAIHAGLLRRSIIRDLDRLKWLVEVGAVPR